MRDPRRRVLVPLAAAILGGGGTARAQDESGAPAHAPGDLLEQLRAIEQENRALAARLSAVEAAAAEESARETEREVESAAADEAPAAGSGLTSRWGDTEVSLQLFGDYGFEFRNPESDDMEETSFMFGSMGLLLTGRIGEHVRVLSETLIEGEGDVVSVDEERLWSAYDWSDALYAKLGLEHLPTARWNRMYHHGKWLALTIDRPYLARFEDDGGILAMHESGLEIGGQCSNGGGLLEYIAVVSNGRGPVPSDRQRGADDNHAKAIDLALALSPACLRGLTFGASGRYDVFPEDPNNPARANGEREFTTGGFVHFDVGPVDSLGEIVFLQHQDRTSGRVFHHHSAYWQAGWKCGDFTPYVRADTKVMERGDPYYFADDLDLDAWTLLVGLRYEVATTAALKVEAGYSRLQERQTSGAIDVVHQVSLAAQFSWFF